MVLMIVGEYSARAFFEVQDSTLLCFRQLTKLLPVRSLVSLDGPAVHHRADAERLEPLLDRRLLIRRVEYCIYVCTDTWIVACSWTGACSSGGSNTVYDRCDVYYRHDVHSI